MVLFTCLSSFAGKPLSNSFIYFRVEVKCRVLAIVAPTISIDKDHIKSKNIFVGSFEMVSEN